MIHTDTKTITYDVYYQKLESPRWGRESEEYFFDRPNMFEKVASITVDFDNPMGVEVAKMDKRHSDKRSMQLEQVYRVTQNDAYPNYLAEECAARQVSGMFSWAFIEEHHGYAVKLHSPDGQRSSMVGDVIVCPADEVAWEISGVGFSQI